jgi:3-hydroxybutyryl-CoA dehydrogenase
MNTKNELVIGIIGAGSMGTSIAMLSAQAGHKTILFDINNQALTKAKMLITKTYKSLVEKGKFTNHQIDTIHSRINFVDYIEGFSKCNIVIEAVIEDLEIKQTIYTETEDLLSDETIICSNTSSLSIASLSSKLKRPERFCGLHFFNPATILPLVEIVPSYLTSQDVITNLKHLMELWGKAPVIAKDTPGFIVNRVVRPFYSEALRIYEEGIADFATIDFAMKNIGGFKMGPFELMDFIGNDVNFKVTSTVFQDTFYDSRYRPSVTQQRMVELNHLGRKTNKGFYDYHENAPKPSPSNDLELQNQIYHRIVSMLINEAYEMLKYKTATAEDIDNAVKKGVNYPKGLFEFAEIIGKEKVYNTLFQLYNETLEERYRPSSLLKKEIK